MKPLVTLDSKALPYSGVFVDFVHARVTGETQRREDWHDQRKEKLSDFSVPIKERVRRLSAILNHGEGREIAALSRTLFREIAIGKLDETRRLLDDLRFVFVVGIPRTGGTYLTKQLFRGAGRDYRQASHGLAHDAFPDFAPLSFSGGSVVAMQIVQLAEYLVMAWLYFCEGAKGPAVAPKKFTKLVYDAGPACALLAERSEFVVTLRHPLDMAWSTLEKSGGLPEGGGFRVRSAIENWARAANLEAGRSEAEIASMDYFDVMAAYWRRYHQLLATSGVLSAPSVRLAAFGAEPMEATARGLFETYGLAGQPEAFAPGGPADLGPERERRAAALVEETAALWRHFGAEFPVEEVMRRG